MRQLWNRIAALVQVNARHRSDVRLGEVTDAIVFDHARKELAELEDKPGDIDELGDLLAILYHHAQRQGWSMSQVEQAALEKLKIRFDKDDQVKADNVNRLALKHDFTACECLSAHFVDGSEIGLLLQGVYITDETVLRANRVFAPNKLIDRLLDTCSRLRLQTTGDVQKLPGIWLVDAAGPRVTTGSMSALIGISMLRDTVS